jgi:hypothetical protein
MRFEPHPGGKKSAPSRQKYFREVIQRFLIVCEGQSTEKLYFEAFKVPKDVRGVTVIGAGLNTVSLVEKAIKLRDQATGEYDQVWCVFDVEDYSVQVVNAAIDLANKNHIRVACSNQAFELWYLLHFHFYHTATDRKQYEKKLTDLLGLAYEKNICLYAKLVDRQETALRNAQALLGEYQPYNPARNDPSTTVHLLVEQLNRFTPESRSF